MPEPPSIRRSGSLGWALRRYAISSVLLFAAMVVGATFAARRSGTHEAVRDAKEVTETMARSVAGPELTDAILASDPAAVEAFDKVVHDRILDSQLIRVKLWNGDGKIIYSDDHRLIGETFGLEEAELEALRNGGAAAGVSDLKSPENRFETASKLLEVYTPTVLPSGTRVSFESYFLYDAVDRSAWSIWKSFAPVVFGVLIVFTLVQLPLAWRLGRRVQRAELEREQFLQRAVEASERERQTIAADLHDGVVQDLIGVSLSLAGLAEQLGRNDSTKNVAQAAVPDVHAAAAETRRTIGALRSLLVEIYPPNLRASGLEVALGDLVAAAGSRGVNVSFLPDLRDNNPRDPASEALIFRAAQEALRNVTKHARADWVVVRFTDADGSLVLTVHDDGVGFDPETRPAGHFGLRVLSDLSQQAGGYLTVQSTPGVGTTVTVEVPR